MALGCGAEVEAPREAAPTTTTTAQTTTTAEPPGSAPVSPGPQTQAGASSTSAVATIPLCLGETNADTSAQSFSTYCETVVKTDSIEETKHVG